MCGKWVPNCALICLGSRVSFDLPLALAPGVFMTGPGCGWSKISRVRAPYDNLGPAVKPLRSPESAVYIMDSLLGQVVYPQELKHALETHSRSRATAASSRNRLVMGGPSLRTRAHGLSLPRGRAVVLLPDCRGR